MIVKKEQARRMSCPDTIENVKAKIQDNEEEVAQQEDGAVAASPSDGEEVS
jgi:hypothetical protein